LTEISDFSFITNHRVDVVSIIYQSYTYTPQLNVLSSYS